MEFFLKFIQWLAAPLILCTVFKRHQEKLCERVRAQTDMREEEKNNIGSLGKIGLER